MAAVSDTASEWTSLTGEPARGESRSALAWRALRRNRGAVLGLIVVLCYLVIGAVGIAAWRRPEILPHDYAAQDLMATFAPIGTDGHPLGTDQLGRDMLSRLIVGAGISLAVGFGITALSMVIGIALGSIAGYRQGWTDTIISGIIEITWGFPLILIAVIAAGALGPGLTATVLAVGLIYWAGFARVVRGEVLQLREREFVQAAMATGVSERRILLRHVLPNALGPVIVMATYYVAAAIIVEAGLSFIGMGAQPPLPSLGVMIADGRNYMLLDHWISTLPGLGIVVVVVSLNLLGDGLRDVLDPRLRKA
jgi:ABC-type dipeptide/oligopeptide/nickel transport system permease subunit